MTMPIVIENRVWLGYGVKLKKGTIIPDKSIVASFSVLGNDYSSNGSNCIYGGIPAEVLKRNIIPILNLDEEARLKNMYFKDKNKDLYPSCYSEDYLTSENTNFF